MSPRDKIKFKRIANHLKACLNARRSIYWEDGEVVRFQVDFNKPLLRDELLKRIYFQRLMLARLRDLE